MKTEQIIKGFDKHYFFGFHDLPITNFNEDKALALALSRINRPPYPNEKVDVGYVNLRTKQFIKVTNSMAFNFPQGNRQQWIGKSDSFVFNDRVNDKWGSRIIDCNTNKITKTLDFPVHCLNSNSGEAFYVDYSRLHRVGGYGYIGLEDKNQFQDIPMNCGLFIGNIETGISRLLLSIYEIASTGEVSPVITNYPHYITHLYLNPSKTSIAFLHRYRIKDGGEITRLMTVNTDGSGLRVLLKGSLSHFTWINDEDLIIWGITSTSITNFRESKLNNSKLFSSVISVAKKIAKPLISKSISKKQFTCVKNSDSNKAKVFGKGILKSDGHPMQNPHKSDIIVIDTYPDRNGIRELMLFNFSKNKKTSLGFFRKLDKLPKLDSINITSCQNGMDKRIISKFKKEIYTFSRSGLHCDLHPRWSNDGNTVFFDSIHEGKRAIYKIVVSDYF